MAKVAHCNSLLWRLPGLTVCSDLCQGSNFQAEIQKQIRERQQRAKRKREVKSSYR